MTAPSPREPQPSRALRGPLSATERTMLDEFDAQRRLHLLRLVVPPLLGVVALAMPFAVQADAQSGSVESSLQLGVGLVAFAIAGWAILAKRANIGSAALFAGVAGVILFLLVANGPLQGQLDLSAIPAFALLTLPIAIAGIFGRPRWALVTMAGTSLFTIGMIMLTPHAENLAGELARADGLVVYTVPVATQLALGILIVAATRSFRRTQRELGDVRIAYEREKELEQLKDQFLANVNHELRTPVMALQGYLELARELGARGEAARQDQMLRRGTEAAEHLAGIVKGVLNIRRIDADAATLAPKAFAPQQAVLQAATLLDPREAGEEPRELHVRVGPELRVLADETRVRQVLINLLSNAVKYSPAGSSIEVTGRRETAPDERGGHLWPGRRREPRPMVRLAVRDHGLGIPPDKLPLVFGRFVRLERDIASTVPGTGLGLAICQSYVEAMGGHIWAESAGEGMGTTFVFTLPAATEGNG
ncbi:MAG TPA: HAMP domain-containing sensor histidine kinase [Ktedonobacterales bacterium]